MNDPVVRTIPTTPYDGQRPGTSGLRKKTREFMQPRYLENFVQSVFDSVCETSSTGFGRELLVVGGDGRYFNRPAIQTIVRMAVANGFGRVWVGRGGILSTPAMSAVIRRHKALGGLVLTASHNPAGIDADFGIKYNVANGGPAPEGVTDRIHAHTLAIARYLTIDPHDIDLDHDGVTKIGATEVTVFDPLVDYTAVMESLFDFDALRAAFRRGFRIDFDAMHAVTGPYARHIFERLLGASEGSVVNGTPREDFGGGHADPNLVHAHELVERMGKRGAPDLGAASDGDGDRNLILGPGFFVSPGDSLAIIAEHAVSAIPGYASGVRGVARSMPTSMAVDRVATALGIPIFETPTGWKFFGNLMDRGLCTLCGEESFGTSSNHVREKDGLWAVLAWVSILTHTKKGVRELVEAHWARFGRAYYRRHDFEGLDSKAAKDMVDALRERLPSMVGRPFADGTVAHADDFRYEDPVDRSVSRGQGLRILLADESRVVVRLSGTGVDGATLRLYLERYRNDGGKADVDDVVEPLKRAALDALELTRRCNRENADVVT